MTFIQVVLMLALVLLGLGVGLFMGSIGSRNETEDAYMLGFQDGYNEAKERRYNGPGRSKEDR